LRNYCPEFLDHHGLEIGGVLEITVILPRRGLLPAEIQCRRQLQVPR